MKPELLCSLVLVLSGGLLIGCCTASNNLRSRMERTAITALPAGEQQIKFAYPAITPANPTLLQPLASHNTPAYKSAQLFRRGVNLADYLEAPKAVFNRDISFCPEDFTQMGKEGFDHVRVPVG